MHLQLFGTDFHVKTAHLFTLINTGDVFGGWSGGKHENGNAFQLPSFTIKQDIVYKLLLGLVRG